MLIYVGIQVVTISSFSMNEFPKLFPKESSAEQKAAEEMGKESSEMLIDRVRESLDSGLFDKEEREEVERMLRTANFLSSNPEIKKEIDQLLSDIETLYGKN